MIVYDNIMIKLDLPYATHTQQPQTLHMYVTHRKSAAKDDVHKNKYVPVLSCSYECQ